MLSLHICVDNGYLNSNQIEIHLREYLVEWATERLLEFGFGTSFIVTILFVLVANRHGSCSRNWK